MIKKRLDVTTKFPFVQTIFDTGLLPDTRPSVLKSFDYKHEERDLSLESSPNIFSNKKITHSGFFQENQWYIGDCVAHGVGLGLAIERKRDTGEYVRISPLFPYRLRPNYPSSGAFLQEIFDIYKKNGAPLFTTLPTLYQMTEKQATAILITEQMRNEAAIFKGKNYFMLTKPNDIVSLANIANVGHGVPITIFSTEAEWSKSYPTVDGQLAYDEAPVHHCVSVLPNSGFTENGRRYVTVQDSAWFGGLTLRHLSEDFVTQRVAEAGYWDTVSEYSGGEYPVEKCSTFPLKVGDRGQEVVQLQKLLIAEKLLAPDCATGYFGGLTLAGVHAFQDRYSDEVLHPLGLTAPTNVFGKLSIAKANEIICQH